MATTGQINLIRTIMSEREMEGHHIEWVEERLGQADTALVQVIMNRLKALPRKGAAVQPVLIEVAPTRESVSEVGFYKNDNGFVFKVVKSQVGRLYAKQTTARGLVYIEGAMGQLFADQKMTGEEIAAHGVANCYCVNCSTMLTDPISKQIGLGTSCGPAILTKDAYKAARKAALEIPAVKAAHQAHQAALKADREALKAAQAAREAQVELPLETRELVSAAVGADGQPLVTDFVETYRFMASLGLDDTQIRDARYGAGNW